MRTYFLLLFTLCTCLLQAQPARVVTTQELLKKYRQAVQMQMSLHQWGPCTRNDIKALIPDRTAGNRHYQPLPGNDSTILNLLPLYRAHAQPGIYRLRDGMPCIVPDTKDIAGIPNAWPAPQKLPYSATIPNGGKDLYPVLPQPVPRKDLKKDNSR